MSDRPRLLDLFCGAGGAAVGYGMELAWAAGFFDGEGSVGVQRDKRPGRKLGIYLSIEQVDRRPLERFNRAVGYDRISLRPARTPTRQPIHRVTMGHASAMRTMALLQPWLTEPKWEQFKRARQEVESATSQVA